MAINKSTTFPRINLLSISWDQNLITPNISNAIVRQKLYVKHLKSLTIIVMSSSAHQHRHYGPNLTIIPIGTTNRFLSLLKTLILAVKLHRASAFNLITADDPILTGFTATLLSRYLKLPFNLQLHLDYCYEPNWIKERPINRFFCPLIFWVISRADSIRTVNQALADTLKLRLKSQQFAFAAPMYTDHQFFHRDIKSPKPSPRSTRPDPIRLVSVARLVKQKNLPLLIRAFALAHHRLPQLHLTIVGGGPEHSYLQQLISNLNLNKSVTIAGASTRYQVRRLLHASDIFVLTSNHEGWGMVYLEAMSAGLPVITTPVSSRPELFVHNHSGLITKLTPQSLSNAIIKLATNPKLAHRLAKAAQLHAQTNFTKDKLINAWISGLYQTIAPKS